MKMAGTEVNRAVEPVRKGVNAVLRLFAFFTRTVLSTVVSFAVLLILAGFLMSDGVWAGLLPLIGTTLLTYVVVPFVIIKPIKLWNGLWTTDELVVE